MDPPVQIPSLSCSFWQKNCHIIYIVTPASGVGAPTPLENPGSATVLIVSYLGSGYPMSCLHESLQSLGTVFYALAAATGRFLQQFL